MNDALIGTKLGEYSILSLLGEGGMARVYKGYDERLDRYAAIKVIQPNQLATEDDEEYRERFLREARAIAKLHHPRVVSVYQFGELDNLYYMAMNFVEGRDLRQILKETNKQKKTLSHEQILRITRDIAEALDYSHQQGVIHRDVKPSNIMVTVTGGHSVLTDFGLALSAQEGTIGNTFGSVHYIAPEQAVSSAQAVPQSDLYSLSVVLYEMLTGRVPFDDVSAMSVALKHISDPPPPASIINPTITPQIEDLLNKALDKDPMRRFPTGRALIHALEGAFAVSDEEDTHDVVLRETSLSKLAIPTADRERLSPAVPPSDSWDAIDEPTKNESSRPIMLTALESKTDLGLSTKSRKLPIVSNEKPERRTSVVWLLVIAVLVLGAAAFAVLNMGFLDGDDDGVGVALLDDETAAPTTEAMTGNETTPTQTEPVPATATQPQTTQTGGVQSSATNTTVPTSTTTATATDEQQPPTPTIPPTATNPPTALPNTDGEDAGIGIIDPSQYGINATVLNEPALLLYYTPEQIVIYNRSASSILQIDVRRISFDNVRTDSRFTPEQWTFNASRWRMRPQLDCFQIIDSDLPLAEKPDFCTFLQAFERQRDKFWVSNTRDVTFSVLWDGVQVANCPVVSTNVDDEVLCFVELP